MSEKISMFELLNERMEKEDIVKLVCNYDNKFNELEEENKRLNNIIKERENAINNARKYIQDNVYYSISRGTATLTLENEDFYELEEMLRIG